MIEIPLSKKGKHAGKYVAIVDDCDADLAELDWFVQISAHNTMHAAKDASKKTRPHKLMHRVILARMRGLDELLPMQFVDHINGNGLDNRRENLRLADYTGNNRNQRKRIDNSSGYKGVSFHKGTSKWQANIAVNKKKLYLGLFDTPEEAYEAYKEAAIKYHGEFANFGD